MNVIDRNLNNIADAILRAQKRDGLWELGKEEFYRLSQTTFACRVLLWHGGEHAKKTSRTIDWLRRHLLCDKVLHYPRTLAWPLYLFSIQDCSSWNATADFLAGRLCELQNRDGSWGHGSNPPVVRGSGDGHPFPTSLSILALSNVHSMYATDTHIAEAIRLGVAWLLRWFKAPHKTQPASTALALAAIHASDTHDVISNSFGTEVARLVSYIGSVRELEPEIILNAARRLDAPYVLLSPAWVLFALSQFGDLSTFRTQLQILHNLLTLIQPDGRVGITPKDPSPHIYCAFNVYLALRTFRARYMQDGLLNIIITEKDAMDSIVMGARKSRSRVFVGSSVEGLGVARKVQANFEFDAFDTVIWENGVFKPSHTAIEALEDVAATFDFAILILTPDDMEISRGDIQPAIRDNVLFELGLFIGALGRKRVFMIHPRAHLKKPSDLAGIVMVSYDPVRFEADAAAALGPACGQLRDEIIKLGSRR